MGEVKRVDGNRPWAPIVGYSRAVRIGNLIEVAGTSSTTRDGKVMFPNDAYGQTKYIFEEIERAVKELGATLSCNRDYALIEGFNPDATLVREKTIMSGGDCCTFRYNFSAKT